MTYNPLKKLLYHGSLKEDTLKTIEDLSKVYKIIGLEELVKMMENKIGILEFKDKFLVETVYLSGSILVGSGIYTVVNKTTSDNYISLVIIGAGFITYSLGLGHHFESRQRPKGNYGKIP